MTLPKARAELRDVLARLYPDEISCRRVAADAGLNEQRIAFAATAVNTWHSILREAENANMSENLFDVVLVEYGNRPELARAIEAFQEKSPTKSSVTAAPSRITILFLAANPADTTRVRLDAQSRAIDEAIRASEYRDRFRLEKHFAVRVRDIVPLILRYRPTIVHFTGHGSAQGKIALEDDAGEVHTVSPQALSRVFSVFKDDVRCVVLCACYSEPQAQTISEHIDCVVGMSHTITDSAAITFSASFYLALGYGRDVQTAFELGRVQLELENTYQEHIPSLIAKKTDASTLVLF